MTMKPKRSAKAIQAAEPSFDGVLGGLREWYVYEAVAKTWRRGRKICQELNHG